MLYIAELRGVPFSTLKVKTLILKTTIIRYAVPGISIAKLLQISPGLKKIIFYKTEDWNSAVVCIFTINLFSIIPSYIIYVRRKEF